MIPSLIGINSRRRTSPTGDVIPPSAPVLSAGAKTSSTIALAWTSATDNIGVVGYDVYVNNLFNGSTSATSYTVSGLTSSTQYSIFVKSKDAVGNSTSSNTVIVITLAQGALPAIEGYGVNATGGANSSTVYHVTTLTGTGQGSLIFGIGSNKTIVFDVAGTINQRHDIVNISNLTIDGTTAPYPGVTITASNGDGMSVQGTSNNVIIKGLTFANCTGDGLNVIENATNIVIAHCTAYGNQDGNIDVASDASLVTMQYCLIGWHNGVPSNGTGGTLITGHLVSFHHNLTNTSFNNPAEGERLPLIHRNYGVAGTPDADVRNNLIWMFGRSNSSGSGYGTATAYNAKSNVVNNYYKAGTVAYQSNSITKDDGYGGGATGKVYASGNISFWGGNINAVSNNTEFPIVDPYKITSEDACTSANKVLVFAGTTQRNPADGTRNPTEQSLLANITLTGCSGTTSSTTTSSTSSTSTSSTTTTTTTTSSGTRSNLIFEALFEGAQPNSTPSIGVFESPLQSCCETTPSCCGYSATISTSHPRTGTKCYRAEVRASDPAAHSGWRSEVVPNYSGGLQDSGNRWYGFSVYFEAPVSNGLWTGSYGGHFIQWHPDNSSGSLSFGLWGSDGLWDVVTNPEGDETAVHHTTPVGGGSAIPIVANVWHDCVFNVNWTTGVTKFWLNGTLHTNVTIPWSSGPSRYLKFGMNRWGNGPGGAPQDTWIIYYDNLRVGNDNATFNDVAP